jgi:hypothetical protein
MIKLQNLEKMQISCTPLIVHNINPKETDVGCAWLQSKGSSLVDITNLNDINFNAFLNYVSKLLRSGLNLKTWSNIWELSMPNRLFQDEKLVTEFGTTYDLSSLAHFIIPEQ